MLKSAEEHARNIRRRDCIYSHPHAHGFAYHPAWPRPDPSRRGKVTGRLYPPACCMLHPPVSIDGAVFMASFRNHRAYRFVILPTNKHLGEIHFKKDKLRFLCSAEGCQRVTKPQSVKSRCQKGRDGRCDKCGPVHRPVCNDCNFFLLTLFLRSCAQSKPPTY